MYVCMWRAVVVAVSFSPPCVWCQGHISSQLVGSIVGLQSEEIKQMAEEYEGKVSSHCALTTSGSSTVLSLCTSQYRFC